MAEAGCCLSGFVYFICGSYFFMRSKHNREEAELIMSGGDVVMVKKTIEQPTILSICPDEECTICLEDNCDTIIDKCGHVYHTQCLEQWLYEDASCPNCRIRL